jgi:hypothetical protein
MSLKRVVKALPAAAVASCCLFWIADAADVGCSRAGLNAAVDAYIAALEAGDYTLMPLSATAKYIENDSKTSSFGHGLWETPLTPDFHRSLIDVDSCATFSEIIDTSSSTPYVLGVRLRVSSGKISEVYAVVTTTGYWGFNAKNYLRYSMPEDWSELPAGQRLTREELRAGSYAYFAYWSDKTVRLPVSSTVPCSRIEGGMWTGEAVGRCTTGIPSQQMSLRVTTYLADVDYGMVVLFLNLGGSDTHLYRILPTGYRYIHTITAMLQSDFPGNQTAITRTQEQTSARFAKVSGGKLRLNLTERGKVDIYALNGVKIRARELEQGSHTLNISGLPRGTYMVRTTSGAWKSSVRMQVK